MTVDEGIYIALIIVRAEQRSLVYLAISSCPEMNVAKPGPCWMKEIPETMVLQRINVSPAVDLAPGINL